MHKFKIRFSVPQKKLKEHIDCTADVQVNDKDVYQVYNIVPDLMESGINTTIELKVIDGKDLDIQWVELTKPGISASLVATIGKAIEYSLF